MIISQTAQSFYSRTFYYNLARHAAGIGMRFVVLLSIIITLWLAGILLYALPTQLYPNNMVSWLTQVAEKLPAISYKDDRISIDQPVPYIVDMGNLFPNSHKETNPIVINTNYIISNIDALKAYMKSNHVFMLVTADKVVTLKDANGNEVDITDLKSTFKEVKQPATITHEDWKKFIDAIQSRGVWWLGVFDVLMLSIVLIMCFAAVFMFAFIATVIDAVVVMIISLILSIPNDFSACMRLAAAARMPIVYISFLASFSPGLSWFIWILYLGIAAFDSKDNNLSGHTA